MHAMLQLDAPEDLVIATGETHTVREFCELAFGELGLDWRDYVRQDDKFKRPAEVELLVGDASRARAALGWVPEITFASLVKEMVRADYELFSKRLSPEAE
jgi:GDPmannose 4,6-dehydratase